MRIKILIGVVLGVLLWIIAICSVMILKNEDSSSIAWRPSQTYSDLGNSSRFSRVSYFRTPASAGSDILVPMSSSSRRVSSSRGYNVSSVAGASASSSSVGTNGQPLISYMASSADYRSFGGGGNVGDAAVSGGVVRSANSTPSAQVGITVSMPSTSMYAYANNRNASSVVTNDLMSSVSGDIAMASSYAGIGNTTGPRGMSGRKNIPGIGTAEWTGWLDEEWEGGYDGITWNMLRDLYVKMTGDTDFSNEELWNSFLTWFEGNQSNDEFGWYWAPISDAVPVVLLLCLAYAFVIYRKTRQAKKANAEN